jgi:hypothetical protein
MLGVRGDEEWFVEEHLLALAGRNLVTLSELRSISGVPVEARAFGQAIEDIIGHAVCIYPINTIGKGRATGLSANRLARIGFLSLECEDADHLDSEFLVPPLHQLVGPDLKDPHGARQVLPTEMALPRRRPRRWRPSTAAAVDSGRFCEDAPSETFVPLDRTGEGSP